MQVDPKLGQMRIPDILETIADLSNDEVFTPPDLANKALDMLPQEIWSNSEITFLDPACKTGVFLREITKRLLVGLEKEIPDLQERVNHILTKQVYGLAITELTALMSRRTVYCATKANSEASVVTTFDNADGNIKFPKSKHNFHEKTKKCTICGAGEDLYHEIENRDNYAYSFLHDDLKEVFGNVKFDVIIGNPPYQLNVGNEGGNSSRAIALYHHFVNTAIDLQPIYISMIIPSRWMTQSSSGIPDDWGKNFIRSNKIKEIHDYEIGDGLFRGSVGVNGGINYFLWDKEHNGKCKYNYYKDSEDSNPNKKYTTLDSLGLGFVIRDPLAQNVIEKIERVEGKYYNDKNKVFSTIVSPLHYNDEISGNLSSKWRDYKKEFSKEFNVKYFVSLATNGVEFGWIKESQIPKHKEILKINKIFIPSANGTNQILGRPRFGGKMTVASETYLNIGYANNYNIEECKNIMKYISTKFFRYLVSIKKITQNGARNVYELVPMQDWSKELTDEILYKKYELTKEEIEFIEESIPKMDISKELSDAK